MNRSILATTCGCVVAAAILAGCSEPVTEAPPVRPVRTIKVGDLEAIRGRQFPGRASAKNEVELSFEVAGPLVSLPVDVGTTVEKGEVIAALDPRDYQTAVASNQANLERAKANLLAMQRGARPEEIAQLKSSLNQAKASHEQAVAEHERHARLAKSNAVSQSEFDISLARQKRTAAEVEDAQEALNIGMAGAREEDLEAKRAEIRSLEASLEAAQNQLDDATLVAPFAGEISALYADNFQRVQAKQPIARLVDISEIEVTVQIPESLIGLVPQIDQVACRFDALGDREFIGTVTKIGREASQTTRTYPVTVQISQPEDSKILPGMAATVRNHREPDAEPASGELIVPASALFTAPDDDSQTFVWVFDEGTGKVSRRAITTREMTPVGLRVEEGLKVGERVVTSGVNSLREGQVVKLL